jgi:threonyl-tRNA synthetase
LVKVPIIAVVGKKEAEDKTVALRRLGGNNQEILALAEARDRLGNECAMPG